MFGLDHEGPIVVRLLVFLAHPCCRVLVESVVWSRRWRDLVQRSKSSVDIGMVFQSTGRGASPGREVRKFIPTRLGFSFFQSALEPET